MPEFVVHLHAAEKAGLHHDFRLESGGVLKSWAVPKGVPTEPGVKVLAIKVEDHPIDYKSFIGEITEGYGKGLVDIFDCGDYDLIRDEETTKLVNLHGDKLNGYYYLRHWQGNRWFLWKRD